MRREKEITESEMVGRWSFQRNILDRLDSHLRVMKCVKKFDEDYYGLCKHLGAIVAPQTYYKTLVEFDESDALLAREDKLGFGAMAFADDIESGRDARHPCMVLFHRRTKAYGITESYNGPVYGLLLVYYWPKTKDYYACGEIPIAVLPDGGLMILRQYEEISQRLPKGKRDGAKRGRAGSILSLGKWQFSHHIAHLAREWKVEIDHVMQHILTCFQLAYAAAYFSQSDTRVVATKDGISSAFSVDMLSLPDFFADRDRGNRQRRRPIFHIVRSHLRRNGSVVHSHVKGDRVFMWNGFQIRITLPGKHHQILTEHQPGATGIDDPELKPGHRYYSMTDLAKKVAKAVSV